MKTKLNKLAVTNLKALKHFQTRHENLLSLWKHAYSNILKILQPKNENFQITKSAIFHIPAQTL